MHAQGPSAGGRERRRAARVAARQQHQAEDLQTGAARQYHTHTIGVSLHQVKSGLATGRRRGALRWLRRRLDWGLVELCTVCGQSAHGRKDAEEARWPADSGGEITPRPALTVRMCASALEYHVQDPQAASPPSEAGPVDRSSCAARRVLIVAGQADIRHLAATCATGGGWLIEACATGTDAVFHLSAHPPDVLVYAEPLPDMSMSRLWRAAGPALRYAVRIHAAAWPALEPRSPHPADEASGPCPGHVRTIDVLPRADALDRVLRGLETLVTGGNAPSTSSILDAEDGVWHGMVGTTPVMRDLFGLIRRLAPHVRTALILGEPGSGKETVARVLHRAGPRATAPFVALDCASLGEVASDTFGAPWRTPDHDSWGVFHQVSGGVLFLDAVGELTATAQGRLLSALEARGCGGAGPPGPGPDVHVFAASDRDLRSEVASGRFRRDLFYHLSVVELRVPALRERRTDIIRLAVTFLQASARRLTHALEGFTEDAEALLTHAPWEGNVRELRSLVERVSLLAEGPLVTAREVLACLPGQLGGARAPAAADRDAVERAQLMAALDDAGGNKKAAAERLGLSRRAFYRRLERLAMVDTISRRSGRRLAS